MDEDIYTKMFDATVRIEAAWPFPVCEPPSQIADLFEDGEDRLPKENKALVEHWDEEMLEVLYDGEGWEFSDVYAELCAAAFRKGVKGWLGLAATPVFTPNKIGGASFSWGHYRTKLIFAPTSDALLEASVVWAEQERNESMSRDSDASLAENAEGG